MYINRESGNMVCLWHIEVKRDTFIGKKYEILIEETGEIEYRLNLQVIKEFKVDNYLVLEE